MNSKPSIRFFLATALSLGLVVSSQLPIAGFSGSAAADLNLKSVSQLKSEAALYDTAIREISRISSMKLANPDESKAAIAIVKKQAPNLRFIRSKLIVLGFNDSTFVNAAKAKTGNDKKSAQQFAAELAKDRTAILKLNGAESLKNRMLRTVEQDRSLLRKIADQFKQAAADIRAKSRGHHVRIITANNGIAPTGLATDSSASLTPVLPVAGEGVALVVIVVAVIVCPPLGLALVDLAQGAIIAEVLVVYSELIAAGAVQLILDLKASAESDKQKDEIANCQDAAKAAWYNCMTAADKLIFPLDVAAEDACTGVFFFDLAACLLI